MKHAKRILGAVSAAIIVTAPVWAQTETAQMDKPVKAFAPFRSLVPDAKTVSLTDTHKAVVLVFIANRCGVTWLYADRIAAIQKQYAGKIAIVGVHSNVEETDAELMTELKKRKLNLSVIDDKPAQQLATYFGATVTPYFVVIDGNGILRYKGAFDKMGGSIAESKREQFLRPALDAVLAGKPVAKKAVRALGCEIARRSQSPKSD